MAWGNQDHMASGEAAYDELVRTDPAVVRSVVEIAASLPRREHLYVALKGVVGPVRDRLTFAYLARWPDDIRQSSFDRPAQHYRLRVVSDIGALLTIRNGEADGAYKASMTTLRNRAARR